MKIRNIHSVVDLITNSSTVIYTQARAGSINTIKEIINTILDIGGSDLKADDLFTFHIKNELDFEYDDEIVDILDDYSDQNIRAQYEKIWNPNLITDVDCCDSNLTKSYCPSCGSNRDDLLYKKNQYNRRPYNDIVHDFKEYLNSIELDEEKITKILIDSDYRDGNFNSFLILTPIEGVNAPTDLGNKLGQLFQTFESSDY